MKLLSLFIIFVCVIALLIFSISRGGCSNSRHLCIGKDCFNAQPYGVFDGENKKEGVKYKASIGNIVLSIIFIETIFVPVVLCGWYLWEPVGLENKQ